MKLAERNMNGLIQGARLCPGSLDISGKSPDRGSMTRSASLVFALSANCGESTLQRAAAHGAAVRDLSTPVRSNAFTLIEVLLAVAVFAIVLGAINSVFFGALRLRNKSYAVFEKALPMQQATAIFKRDLEGSMAPGGTFGGTLQTTATKVDSTTAAIGLRVSTDVDTSSGYMN